MSNWRSGLALLGGLGSLNRHSYGTVAIAELCSMQTLRQTRTPGRLPSRAFEKSHYPLAKVSRIKVQVSKNLFDCVVKKNNDSCAVASIANAEFIGTFTLFC